MNLKTPIDLLCYTKKAITTKNSKLHLNKLDFFLFTDRKFFFSRLSFFRNISKQRNILFRDTKQLIAIKVENIHLEKKMNFYT